MPGLECHLFVDYEGLGEKVRGSSSSLGLRLLLPKFDRLDMAL